jgi:Ser/Thr protein kinase RdoA (MazF antagonist)
LFISDTVNVIFRGDTANQSYSIRVYREQFQSIPEILGELYWLLDLKQNTNLIVPEPLKTIAGHFVQEITLPDTDNKYQAVIFQWIPGEIIGSNLNAKIAEQLGELMAELHTHAAKFELPTDSFRDGTDWRGMGHLRAGLTSTEISRIEGFLDKGQIALCDEVANSVASTINEVDIRQNFGLIHSDLHANNCLSHAGQIGLIDFADCQFAPFSCDMAITLSSFDDFPNPKLLYEAFLRGYSKRRELPQNYAQEIEAFAIERRLRLIRWVSTWPSVDHFSFGEHIINNSLRHFMEYIESDPPHNKTGFTNSHRKSENF